MYMAATNPLFTVAFDLASTDHDYGAFLAGIRERLGNPRHISHNRPVLPPVEPGAPRRWLHVLLRTPASTLTLATRADNLYLAGFQSADGTWWELSRHGTFRWRRQGLIPGAMPLGFSGTYRDLTGGTRQLANVALGRRQMADAVDTLAAHTASGGDSHQTQQQRRLAKDALVVLLLMVHEATKFLDVAAVVTGLMRPGAAAKSGRITRIGRAQDLGWRYWSDLLLSADSRPGMSAGLGEPRPACYNTKWVEEAAAAVGILLFVDVENGIKAEKARRLFHRDMCGKGTDGAGVDVTFVVSGESVIAAHRYVLAGKSAVFLRQLIGHREGKKTTPVQVEDMDAATFRAMVHFIYTDTVPEFDDQRRRTPEKDEAVATMAHHLLAAAERYELERLKLICKHKLQSGAIYVDMAARTLALAEQHGYRRLKAKCIDFIVRTPDTLHAVLETEGYKHLEASCPAVLTELLKSVHGKKQVLK